MSADDGMHTAVDDGIDEAIHAGIDTALEAQLRARLDRFDLPASRGEFERQGAFLSVPGFLDEALTTRLAELALRLTRRVNRNYLPGHKQGGSVSRHTIDREAPLIPALYRSPALCGWLASLCGERLLPSPPDDPHAYALYYYTRAGDHIGWHYDTSYYAGKRYTALLGVLDESACRLDYELHTRETGARVVQGSMQIPPGGLVFFDGDKLRHRITPLGEGQRRISLTLEYVTDPRMRRGWRLISNLKDAVGYFGFRQVFRRTARKERTDE